VRGQCDGSAGGGQGQRQQFHFADSRR
jgi:hypothetical protein